MSEHIVKLRAPGLDYHGADPSILLFNWAVQRQWPMPLRQGARVLELGCAESDFSDYLLKARPDLHLIGLDVRAVTGYKGTFIQRAVEDWDIHCDERFDAVIALGSIEHFGLGYYGDSLSNGDMIAGYKAGRWLDPGGWFYLDVPWTPGQNYIPPNRHFRVYDEATVALRLQHRLTPVGVAWADCHDPYDWQDERPEVEKLPFWYTIRLFRKPL